MSTGDCHDCEKVCDFRGYQSSCYYEEVALAKNILTKDDIKTIIKVKNIIEKVIAKNKLYNMESFENAKIELGNIIEIINNF